MPRAKIFLHEVWHKNLPHYIGMKLVRTNGLVELVKIDGFGIHYKPIGEKTVILTVSPRQFFVVGAYLPDYNEDEQYKEVHSYAWDDALALIPKREANGLFIPGMTTQTKTIYAHIDNYGLLHVTSRTRTAANGAADEARADQLKGVLNVLRADLERSGIVGIDPKTGGIYL